MEETVKVVSEQTGISRFTLAQAAKRGALKGSARRSGRGWLIDPEHIDFVAWLRLHQVQPATRNRIAGEVEQS